MYSEKKDDIYRNDNLNGVRNNNEDMVDNTNHDEIKLENEKQAESVIKGLKDQFNTTNSLLLSLGRYQQDSIKNKMEEMKQSFEKNKNNKNAIRDALSNLTRGYTEILTYSNLREKEREVINDLQAQILKVGQKYRELKSIKMFADIVSNFENNVSEIIENSLNITELTKNDIVSNSNNGMNIKRGSSIFPGDSLRS